MRRIRYLTNRHRTASTNRMLGLLLAFNAGAVNAGGFLVLHMYTSHMTGFASQLADGLVLGNSKLLLNALGAVIAFVSGAAVCSILVNWGRQFRLRSIYATPLFLEAALMVPFGLMGTMMLSWTTPFAVPLTVLLLSFIMGLQNAIGSKISGGSIRTTHMTGNITDIGIELGKILYWNGAAVHNTHPVSHNAARFKSAVGLMSAFILGGIIGALGFAYIGFVCVIPLAALLLTLSLPPFLKDLPRVRSPKLLAQHR